MLRIVLGVIAGFLAWVIVWVGIEKILIAILPEWYGAPQLAFQHAVENQVDQFTAETRLLLSHIVIGSIVSVMSGFLAALIAGENKRAPMVLGFLLLGIWFTESGYVLAACSRLDHIIFTAIIIPKP